LKYQTRRQGDVAIDRARILFCVTGFGIALGVDVDLPGFSESMDCVGFERG